MKSKLIPLIIFVALLAILGIGLNLDPREIPSPFIGKPAPEFTLSQLKDPAKKFSPEDLKGKIWLLNVWASWCTTCREEHPLLVAFSKQKIVPIIGLNYKDKTPEAIEWLNRMGDPYELSVADIKGNVGIDYGVYGVPETFLIDQSGKIVLKHTGPITDAVMNEKILPLIKKLNNS